MDLVEALMRVITKNEIDGNMDYAYRFSDPDGLRTGKSGYSFGRCQFDINNNPLAVSMLKDLGFTDEDIARLKAQKGDISNLNAKLRDHAVQVDLCDERQIRYIIRWVRAICDKKGITFADDEAFIHACDYHNQFYMNPDGKAINYFVRLGKPVTAEDVRAYKLTTIWGKKAPDDVERRYRNIVKVMRAAGKAG